MIGVYYIGLQRTIVDWPKCVYDVRAWIGRWTARLLLEHSTNRWISSN
jgi:hypothetical protein